MASGRRERDELYSEGTYGTATSSLLRMVGGWGNFSGPSLFMLRVLVSGSATAVAFGITGSVICAMIFGTASIPWMVCSCSGFVLGTIGIYQDSLSKALLAIDLYPKLLQLHLDTNFPWRGFRNWNRNQLRSVEFSRSWTLRSMLVVSWMTASHALDEIFEAKQRAIIEEASQGSSIRKEGDRILEETGKDVVEKVVEAAL